MTAIDLGPVKATYRANAPETSRVAAEAAAITRSMRALELLEAFADAPDGLTADQASSEIGATVLYGRPVVCRLRQEGYLTWSEDDKGMPVRRSNVSGKKARVLEITVKGMQAVGL